MAPPKGSGKNSKKRRASLIESQDAWARRFAGFLKKRGPDYLRSRRKKPSKSAAVTGKAKIIWCSSRAKKKEKLKNPTFRSSRMSKRSLKFLSRKRRSLKSLSKSFQKKRGNKNKLKFLLLRKMWSNAKIRVWRSQKRIWRNCGHQSMRKNFRNNPLKKDAEARRPQNEGLMSSKNRWNLSRKILNSIFPSIKRKTWSRNKRANVKLKKAGGKSATSRKLWSLNQRAKIPDNSHPKRKYSSSHKHWRRCLTSLWSQRSRRESCENPRVSILVSLMLDLPALYTTTNVKS